jgi:hypothetical protein
MMRSTVRREDYLVGILVAVVELFSSVQFSSDAQTEMLHDC